MGKKVFLDQVRLSLPTRLYVTFIIAQKRFQVGYYAVMKYSVLPYLCPDMLAGWHVSYIISYLSLGVLQNITEIFSGLVQPVNLVMTPIFLGTSKLFRLMNSLL